MRVKNLLKTFSERDMNALKSIYDFRCLNFNQIYELHYKYSELKGTEVSHEYLKKKMVKFKKHKILEEMDMMGKIPNLYFLTTDGIKLLKIYFDFPENIYDVDRKLHRRGYLTSSELKVSQRFANHQHHLNEFVIGLKKITEETISKYEDEKHIKSFVGIRPDGIFTVFDNNFFLEMDMGTESDLQLREKWNHYREFTKSNEYNFKERNITIMFIIDGIKKVEQRKNLIKKSLADNFIDLAKKDFELYVGTKEELWELFEDKIISILNDTNNKIKDFTNCLQQKHNFKFASGENVKDWFNDTEYLGYIQRGEGENFKDFIIEEMIGDPLSAINKISYIDYNNTFFQSKYKRKIGMIVLLEDTKTIYDDLRLFNMFNDNVYYTTLSRLNKRKFHEALFKVNKDGNVFVFTDEKMEQMTYKTNIKKQGN